MIIESKINFIMYFLLMLSLSFRNARMKLFTAIGCILLLYPVLYFTGFLENPPYLSIVLGLIILILPFILIYMSSRKSYKSNTRLMEKISYEITEKYIRIKGESFNSAMDWTKIFKILELKNWILIYQNEQAATIIPKVAFGEKISEFRNMVKSKKINSELKN